MDVASLFLGCQLVTGSTSGATWLGVWRSYLGSKQGVELAEVIDPFVKK